MELCFLCSNIEKTQFYVKRKPPSSVCSDCFFSADPAFLVYIHDRTHIVRLRDPLVCLIFLPELDGAELTSKCAQAATDAAIRIDPGEIIYRDGIHLTARFTDTAGRADVLPTSAK